MMTGLIIWARVTTTDKITFTYSTLLHSAPMASKHHYNGFDEQRVQCQLDREVTWSVAMRCIVSHYFTSEGG